MAAKQEYRVQGASLWKQLSIMLTNEFDFMVGGDIVFDIERFDGLIFAGPSFREV